MSAPVPDIVETFRSDMLDVVWHNMYPLVVESMLLVIHAVLASSYVWRRFMDRKTDRHAIYKSLVASTMFSLASTYWALDMYNILASVWDAADAAAATAHIVSATLSTDDGAMSLELAQQTVACAILLCGDYVVLWRAYCIFERPQWLWVISLVIAVACTAVYSALVAFQHQDIGRVINVGPNLIATLLVVYKTWMHWKDVRSVFETGARHTLFIRVCLVVLEAGFVQAALTTSYAIILFALGDTAASWLAYVLIPLFAMYPTLVVVLVDTRHNLLERSIQTASTSSDLQRGISFASVTRDSGYSIRTRRPKVRRMDSDVSSRESITPLNVSFGPIFEPSSDLLDDIKDEDAQHSDQLLTVHHPLSYYSEASDGTKVDSVVVEIGHGHP